MPQDAVVIGGLDMQTQAKALAQRPHIVVATPGRLRVSHFKDTDPRFLSPLSMYELPEHVSSPRVCQST